MCKVTDNPKKKDRIYLMDSEQRYFLINIRKALKEKTVKLKK